MQSSKILAKARETTALRARMVTAFQPPDHLRVTLIDPTSRGIFGVYSGTHVCRRAGVPVTLIDPTSRGIFGVYLRIGREV